MDFSEHHSKGTSKESGKSTLLILPATGRTNSGSMDRHELCVYMILAGPVTKPVIYDIHELKRPSGKGSGPFLDLTKPVFTLFIRHKWSLNGVHLESKSLVSYCFIY